MRGIGRKKGHRLAPRKTFCHFLFREVSQLDCSLGFFRPYLDFPESENNRKFDSHCDTKGVERGEETAGGRIIRCTPLYAEFAT